MVKYLNAECYKAFRRKYFYLFLGAILALAAAFMLLLRVEGMHQSQTGDGMIIIQRVSVSELLGVLAMALSVGLYFCLIAADMVFSEQYKYNTLKNEVSFGLPRLRIYLGKLLSSVLVAVVMCAVLVGGYLLLAFALFPTGADRLGESLRTFGLCLAAAFPLWLGGLGFFTMLQFLLRGSTAATVVYVMVIGLLGGGFLSLMSMFIPALEPLEKLMTTISLNTPFNLMRTQSPESLMGYAWALGLGWLAVSTLVGLVGFRKKEIN